MITTILILIIIILDLLITIIMIIVYLMDMIICNMDGHCDHNNSDCNYYDVVKSSPSDSSELSMMKISFSSTSQLSMLPSLEILRRMIGSLRQMIITPVLNENILKIGDSQLPRIDFLLNGLFSHESK